MNGDTKLSAHFWLSEFTVSAAAARRRLNNDPSEVSIQNLRELCGLLEAIRVLLGGNAVVISSGYRSAAVNALVGGSPLSAHMSGRAADFVCSGYGTPLEVCRRLSDAGLPFDKLIMEGTWVHIQIARPGKAPRKLVYTAHFGEGPTVYTPGLA